MLHHIMITCVKSVIHNTGILKITVNYYCKVTPHRIKQLFGKKMSGQGDPKTAKSVYEFSAKLANGKEISLSDYKGKVLLITNVASKCGFTDTHYQEFAKLEEKYKEQGLAILAFPCNQFMNEEPGTAEEVCQFVKKYNVNFDMFDKVDVNGDSAHPLFKYLKHVKGGLIFDAIKWNFTKFLVDRNGHVVERKGPDTSPLKMELLIQEYLNKPATQQ